MKAQEILAKYENVRNIKKISLSELETLIKNDLLYEIQGQLYDAKLDSYDILDIELSEKIFKNEKMLEYLHIYFKIRLNFSKERAKELLEQNPFFIQIFCNELQVFFKDWILDNLFIDERLLLSTSYLCEELKNDFDFLDEYLSKLLKKQSNFQGFYLKHFKPNKNTNYKLLSLLIKHNYKLTKTEQKRFSNNVTFDDNKVIVLENHSVKEFLNDTLKYQKLLLNNRELKTTYIKLFLEQLQELSDDELKSFLLAFATRPKTFNALLKNYDFCIRLAKLDELLSCIVSNVEIEKLSFSKEQINNLIKLNPKYEKLAKNYEKLIISFSDDATKILEINSLIDDESISELINLAYTKELEYNYLHLSRSIENKDFVSKHSEHNLIINNSLNTAILIRYNDTNKTTEKLIYSFEKAAI